MTCIYLFSTKWQQNVQWKVPESVKKLDGDSHPRQKNQQFFVVMKTVVSCSSWVLTNQFCTLIPCFKHFYPRADHEKKNSSSAWWANRDVAWNGAIASLHRPVGGCVCLFVCPSIPSWSTFRGVQKFSYNSIPGFELFDGQTDQSIPDRLLFQKRRKTLSWRFNHKLRAKSKEWETLLEK